MNQYIASALNIELHTVIGRIAAEVDIDPLELLDLAQIETLTDEILHDRNLDGDWTEIISLIHPIIRRMVEDLSPELLNALKYRIAEEFQA